MYGGLIRVYQSCPQSPLGLSNVSSMMFALIPGAGGSAWYWHRLEPELRQRGHDVVAVNLPAAEDAAGLPEYADAVVEAIGAAQNVVLVAQSMAGFTAPLVCQRVPVALLVFLNAMIPRPGETPGEWWDATGHAEAKRANDLREGRPPDAEFDPLVEFFHDVPHEVVEEAFSQEPPRQSDTPFGSRLPQDPWPSVPTRVLITLNDRFFPVDFQRRVAQERLGITPDEMPGGHLVALSRPAELADRLDAYAALSRAASPAPAS
jgi:Alpha/beta hydrolase family